MVRGAFDTLGIKVTKDKKAIKYTMIFLHFQTPTANATHISFFFQIVVSDTLLKKGAG